MGTNCVSLVADLFLFCYERDFMMSLSDDKQADIIDAFNTESSYLDDILNINIVYFDNMVCQIYLQSSNLTESIPLIPNPRLLTCIYLFLMILFLPKFIINVTTLILKLLISHFLMGMLLALHPMESISLNSFDLLEHLAMLLTSTLVINCKLRNFFNNVIGIINFA